jgi:hypothetical protein
MGGVFLDLARATAALILAWFCGLRASSYTLLAMAIAAALRNSFMGAGYPPVSDPTPFDSYEGTP